ncbi:MAG: SDR family NAD(P)-dependent oxidoreductase [Gammaproteobacteria bacterium]
MDLQLTGKRALVTGSSAGIGAGTARILAAEGARVAVHGRDRERTGAVAEAIRAAGGEAVAIVGDIATPAGSEAVARAVDDAFGGLDILVNNAGGKTAPGSPRWDEIGWDDWLGTYELNVGASVRLMRHFAPGMAERGWGRIVNLASASAVQPEPHLAEYNGAKAAIIAITATMARNLAHTGVTVNTVTPGLVMTPAIAGWFTAVGRNNGWGEDLDAIEGRITREMIPLCTDRIGRPEDIGRMIAFLASPASGYITGANFRVDGGQCRSVN